MNVVRVYQDGTREVVSGYGAVNLVTGRAMVKSAAASVAGAGGNVVEEVVARDTLRVYVAAAYAPDGTRLAVFEEEWPDGEPATEAEAGGDVAAARKLFGQIDDLDGYGLVATDDDLLAERIAELFGVRPEEVYDEYGTSDEDDEDDEDDEVADRGVTMVALCTPQGTACAEAGVCSDCDTPELRAKVEADAVGRNRDNPEHDRPVPGVWHDATGNDAVACQGCGKITVDAAAHAEMDGQKPDAADECQRCGSARNAGDYCTDATCPFSDHAPDCPAGWAGHPDAGRNTTCTCRKV